MKYKILLLGHESAVISDFFHQLFNDFDMVTSSAHFLDLTNHIEFFAPDAIIFCVDNNARKIMTNMMSIQEKSMGAGIPFIVLGTKEECDACMKIGANTISHTIVKPISAASVRTNIQEFLDRIRIAEEKELRATQQAELDKKNETKQESLKHILLIDDDVTLLKTMKGFLGGEYKVATAVNGIIALHYLENKKTDIIFLDYEMPGMDGPEVLRRIRENPELADIPVVFLTGASEWGKISKAIAMKPQGYLLKPVTKEQLTEKICELLG